MLPFSGFSSIGRSESKALLWAALFSCLFIVVLGVARPHQRHTRRFTNEIMVPTPAPYQISEPDLSSLDSIAKFRIRPEQFDEVDFTSHSYGPFRLSDGKKIDLSLDHGLFELPNNAGWFELKDVFYTDMTGDGREEAIVRLFHETCSGSCDGGANLFYIYTMRNGKLKQIWQYETGSYADGCGLQSFTAGGNAGRVGIVWPLPGREDEPSQPFEIHSQGFDVHTLRIRRPALSAKVDRVFRILTIRRQELRTRHSHLLAGLLSVTEVNRPRLRIKLDRLWSLFTHAVTRFFCPTERQLIFNTSSRQVHCDQSRFDAIDELVHARKIPQDDQAESPNRTPFAISIASSKSSAIIRPSTGPNTSSCAIRIFGVTPVKIVGSIK